MATGLTLKEFEKTWAGEVDEQKKQLDQQLPLQKTLGQT